MASSEDLEFARQSIVEELQAINWYQRRIEKCGDERLRKILTHNMNEEKEHVAMLMEWVRENDKEQDRAFEEHD